MDVWKYEIISCVEQDIPVYTRNKFHISAHPCIVLYVYSLYIVQHCTFKFWERNVFTYFLSFWKVSNYKSNYAIVVLYWDGSMAQWLDDKPSKQK